MGCVQWEGALVSGHPHGEFLTMYPDEPLQYPSHYPPTGRWKRFFLGVRWIGPDLSFFKALRSNQASRASSSMDAWGGGDRQALAAAVGVVLSRHCRWPAPYFLPGDSLLVIAGGPSFAAIDDADIEDAIRAMEDIADVKLETAFWEACGPGTVGALVDHLLTAAGPDSTFKAHSLRAPDQPMKQMAK